MSRFSYKYMSRWAGNRRVDPADFSAASGTPSSWKKWDRNWIQVSSCPSRIQCIAPLRWTFQKKEEKKLFSSRRWKKQKRQLLLSCRLFNEDLGDTAATSCLEVTDGIPPRIEAEKKIIEINGRILQWSMLPGVTNWTIKWTPEYPEKKTPSNT